MYFRVCVVLCVGSGQVMLWAVLGDFWTSDRTSEKPKMVIKQVQVLGTYGTGRCLFKTQAYKGD
jgi:hypothetical protein